MHFYKTINEMETDYGLMFGYLLFNSVWFCFKVLPFNSLLLLWNWSPFHPVWSNLEFVLCVLVHVFTYVNTLQ